MKITVKRVYDEVSPHDGLRILVDRLWPRGLSKESAHLDAWIKAIAPSNELRQWYQHEEEKWPEFQKRYTTEIKANPDAVQEFLALMGRHNTTLLFASKEGQRNNAVVLKAYLEKALKI